ncbi:MAG: ATPase, T2SS/T4P/T4SS family [Pseudomonadota bacterium]
MTTNLLNTRELQGSIIPPMLLDYCLELSEKWRANAQSDLAIMATEAGMLVCSPAVPRQASLEFNNVKQLLTERLQKEVVTAYASAANIRSLLHEADRDNNQQNGREPGVGVADKTRAQQTLIDLVTEAVAMQASDIHLRFTPVIAHINFRVKGRLIGAQRRSREAMVESIAATLNTCSDDYRDVFNEQSSDSASIDLLLPAAGSSGDEGPQKVRLRLQKSPLNNGFAVTLRILPERSYQSLLFDQLNMPEDVQAGMQQLLQQRHGLVLIVGATGHGKTTSLAALNGLFGKDKKVISLEDPIEIVQPLIEQRWVDAQTERFAEHIKTALREDPDVISISEIRDTATAQAAVTAALTGHLVTATLHAHDCIGAIQRLQNLGIEINELIAEGVLQGIVAQHLVHQPERTCLVAEYVMIDYPARRYLRRGDYNGWRQHLVDHGWLSIAQRWRQRGYNATAMAEQAQVYHYHAEGPVGR